MELGTIDRLRGAGDAPMARSVAEGRNLVDTMVRTVRDLALGLRPSMLDDLGLQAALEWHARDFTRRYALAVDIQVSGDLDRLPDQHRTAVYRIIQEALTNVLRHAQARTVQLALTRDPSRLLIRIRDDGSATSTDTRGGHGIDGMRERARALSGWLTAAPHPDGGFEVCAELPIPNRNDVPR
jgi:signal transduction histidine kinase